MVSFDVSTHTPEQQLGEAREQKEASLSMQAKSIALMTKKAYVLSVESGLKYSQDMFSVLNVGVRGAIYLVDVACGNISKIPNEVQFVNQQQWNTSNKTLDFSE